MHRIICDRCGEQAPPKDQNLGPAPWVRVSGGNPKGYSDYDNPRNYCSVTCAAQALEQQIVDQAKAANIAEAAEAGPEPVAVQ